VHHETGLLLNQVGQLRRYLIICCCIHAGSGHPYQYSHFVPLYDQEIPRIPDRTVPASWRTGLMPPKDRDGASSRIALGASNLGRFGP
jgi:hypothetical protein